MRVQDQPLFGKSDCNVKWVLDEYGEFPAQFSENAKRIVRDQYFRQGEESFWDLTRRIVCGLMSAPKMVNLSHESRQGYARFLCAGLANQRFAFNSPVYYNVGITPNPQCSACFIQPVEDDMESIIRLFVHADLFEIEGLIHSTGWSASATRA